MAICFTPFSIVNLTTKRRGKPFCNHECVASIAQNLAPNDFCEAESYTISSCCREAMRNTPLHLFSIRGNTIVPNEKGRMSVVPSNRSSLEYYDVIPKCPVSLRRSLQRGRGQLDRGLPPFLQWMPHQILLLFHVRYDSNDVSIII